MSAAEDDKIREDREFRRRELVKGASRLEGRAHELIIEANELRKLETKLAAIGHEAKFEA